MRLFTICMFVFVFGASANSFSQKQTVTLDLYQCDVSTLFQEIWKQTGLRFVYNDRDVAKVARFDLQVKDKAVEEVLKDVFHETTLRCTFDGDVIMVIASKQQAVAADTVKKVTVKGKVTDEAKNPLPGVTVVVKIPGMESSAIGTATDIDGLYELSWVDQKNASLVFTFVGMIAQEVKFTNQKEINVVLKEDSKEVEEVVVTGYFNRTKQSSTGAEVSVKGEELRKVGSLNMLQAISAFDPSVRTLPNNQWGSDPNHVPEISIRGENGFDLRSSADDSRSNPNAPLYIMDGIEVSATTVYDLDMNRVEAFSILKDASATALYGSRGANGVILITTVRPRSGELRVSVNARYDISAPDLSDYNLMNAREKLQYEKLAGVYTSKGGLEEQMNKDELYNSRLEEVARGVDTYWLSKPLRTSVNQRYSVFVEGGDEHMRYGVDLKYDTDKGVMKGSGRERWGAKINLNYNLDNKLIVTNDLNVDDVKGENSPYGDFSQYTKLNPYEREKDPETGELIRRFASNNLKNPLLDATLPNTDYNRYTEVKDNLSVEWRVTSHFQIKGLAALTKNITKNDKYRSAESSEFDTQTDPNQKGSYTISNSTTINFDANLRFMYNNVFADKYTVSAGIGSELSTSNLTGEGFTAVGFLSDRLKNIQYAQQFKKDSKPTGSYDKTKMVGFFANLNVGYDNRYFLDASFRTDGSSKFGRNSRFAPFWSVGAAWNLDKESFWTGTGYMKIRASVGSTGTTNFTSDQALTQYLYQSTSEYNGIYGAVLSAYGNPSLKWQNTLQYNAGVEASVWRNMIVVNFDAYLKRTQNLLLDIDVAPSTGFSSYKENMGSIDNKGFEARLRFNLINDRSRDMTWNVTIAAAHNKNEIRKLSTAMKKMNEEALKSTNSKGDTTMFRLYEEGRSQSALMVVRSLGIDPATGNEIYIKKDGSLTYEYDVNDKVEVGDENPKFQGNVQTNFYWKGFNLYLLFNYEYGAKIYNTTLATKVEGADPLYNADKRVLYDRWKKAGDVAMFRRIDDTSDLYQTTRLVQDNNFINLSSLSLSYDVPQDILSRTFIERCKLTFSMTDVFRISSIKQERGTSYPFARSFSFALNLTF
ncbi:SusC/RagA family TonB-linked outer membrane protein [Butyricimonas paravirosa]|uniref:SusC/RagA family TonB-linked outer membrane protein n=1 Tax=Butyricimonas paravirosa TaxID=1472417 RepID=UPI00210A3501|nr:SusC/RagA family TonB-linked outer membrane protein [Butyricimonas paravirosa]MCQ4873075.1 SusC/RagA family TonB-linked outer membrane protein [Butyricimonas paravirosa]